MHAPIELLPLKIVENFSRDNCDNNEDGKEQKERQWRLPKRVHSASILELDLKYGPDARSLELGLATGLKIAGSVGVCGFEPREGNSIHKLARQPIYASRSLDVEPS